MGTRLQLALLAGVSGIVMLLLGYAARSATASLLEVPPQSWGTGHLSDAVVAGTCTIGALGALWHVASAALALLALPGSPDPHPRQEADVPGLAARILDGWGAPAARRIAASALVVSLSSAPALAAEEATGGDDLGWRPTSSAPASPSPSPVPSPRAGQSSSGPAGQGGSSPTVEPDGSGSHSGSSASPPSQAPSTTPAGLGSPGEAAGSTPPSASGERSPASSGSGTSSGRTHTVAPGESLWSITARLLPAGSSSAQIARSWPVLYHANAGVIGANPSLIRPGTVLTVPSSLTAPSTTTGGQNPSR